MSPKKVAMPLSGPGCFPSQPRLVAALRWAKGQFIFNLRELYHYTATWFQPMEACMPELSLETVWRRVWLKTVMTDGDRPELRSIRLIRLPPRMTLARRLEKLHRLRTALEPPQSWLNKK